MAEELTVPSAAAGERLDVFLASHAGSRAAAQRLIDGGRVTVNGASRPKRHVLAGGEAIAVEKDRPGEERADVPTAPFAVAYEDEHLLVIDKPAGLVVHPGAGQRTGTLVQGLLARYPEIRGVGEDPERPGIVHRLDKGTSGLLLVARTGEAHAALVAALAARDVHRQYRALVWGQVAAARGVIDAPIGRSAREPTKMAVDERGREARTRYEVRQRFAEPVEVTELVCNLETGRTHQIRVHLRSIGHPVVGDARYGGERQSFSMLRPFLHAEALHLAHPISGEAMAFESRLPDDLAEVLAVLS
jgi:23S rRNA pseudouridine1911/1915/1917 synthase